MLSIKYILIYLLLTSLLITYAEARSYCTKSSYVSVWCEDRYMCCENNVAYWCCRSITHSCGSNAGDCKLSTFIICFIIGGVVMIIAFCIGLLIHRRIKARSRRLIIQQQPASYPVQGQGMPMYYPPTQGIPQNQQKY